MNIFKVAVRREKINWIDVQQIILVKTYHSYHASVILIAFVIITLVAVNFFMQTLMIVLQICAKMVAPVSIRWIATSALVYLDPPAAIAKLVRL